MNRRGFTLIETVLAASLGALLVLMVVSMFVFMDRSEGAQVRRVEQTESLSRIHKVMERVFSAVVVADQNTAAQLQSGATDTSKDGKRKPKREPARLLLAADTSHVLAQQMRKFHTGSGAVQRLEVVVDRLPVPRNFARGLTGDVGTSLQANQTGNQEAISGPIRGVFELRPDAATLRVDGQAAPQRENDRVGWTLWWRALRFDEDGPDPTEIDPTEDPTAVPIASGLAACNWKAFVKRERQDTISVISYLDLPAYMEMEVKTLGGYYANWMFEMQWTVAQEDAGELTRQLRETAAGRLKADATTPPGGTPGGAPPGTTTTRVNGVNIQTDRSGNVRVIGR